MPSISEANINKLLGYLAVDRFDKVEDFLNALLEETKAKRLLSGKTMLVDIALPSGKRDAIEMVLVGEHIGIHKEKHGHWKVTHVHSGMSFGVKAKTKKRATVIAGMYAAVKIDWSKERPLEQADESMMNKLRSIPRE